jgi:hypothetical protein
MRKIAIAVTFALTVSFAPAYAATQPKYAQITSAFTDLLTSSAASLEALELEYETAVNGIDTVLAASIKAAEGTYESDLLAASSLYGPQIESANQKVSTAKSQWNSVGQLRLTTGFFADLDRINNYLICPDSRLPNGPTWLEIAKRYCVNENNKPRPGDISTKGNPGSNVGGEDWQKDDVASISYLNADNSYIQQGIARGYLVPVNITGFDSTRNVIRTETANAASLTLKSGSARTSALAKKDAAVAVAQRIRDEALDNLTNDYEEKKAEIEAQNEAAELALLAAKRALKDSANFDKAFAVAYQFEYNRTLLNEIADTPWSGEFTYRTINTIIKASRLADLGESIAAKYSYKSAQNYNLSVGPAFTKTADFKARLKVLQATYKKTTKTTLKVQ